jgi:type IV pilus assembly protein PilP
MAAFARITVLFALALLPACDFFVDGEGTPGGTKAPTGPIAPKKETADEGDAKDEGGFVYNPFGKRDPFKPFIDKTGATQVAEEANGPTQKFDLDQYHLVGIIWGVDRPRALVQDPENIGHVIEVGSYVGKNWGKVTLISSAEVVVTEEYQTLDGELVVNNMSMKLPVDESGSLR